MRWLLRDRQPVPRAIQPRVLSRYGAGVAVKLVLIVRTDLDMGRGKIAAQVAHAAVTAALTSSGTDDFIDWVREGQPKVVLKVPSERGLEDIVEQAQDAGLPVELVRDAGRTQVTPGTLTCCAVGPADAERVDAVTGGLSLL
jgi:peptidyl-tRNA hydrolase, PTH2 family